MVALTASVAVVRLADRQRDADPILAQLAIARDDKAGVSPPSCAGSSWTARDACVSGDPHGTRTIMLLGDSHAAHWRPAVDQVAKELHVRVVMQTFGGVRGNRRADSGRRNPRAP